MYRSIGETTEKLKSLKLTLSFKKINAENIIVIHNGQRFSIAENNFLLFDINSMDEIHEFDFEGFGHDQKEKIILQLSLHGKTLDIHGVSSFQIKNNETIIPSCYEITCDGTLKLGFKTNWILCNIIEGHCLQDGLLSHQIDYENNSIRDKRHLADAEIFAIGCSMTHGTGVKFSEAWPAQLENLLGKKIINLGVPGLSIPGSLMQFRKILKTSTPRTVIFLLPYWQRNLLSIRVLDKNCFYHLTPNSHSFIPDLDQILQKEIRNMLDSKYLEFIKSQILEITHLAMEHNVKVHMSSPSTETHDLILDTAKLPVFPDDTIKERGDDGIHPGPTVHRTWAKTVAELIQ